MNRRELIVSPIPYIPEGSDNAVSMKGLARITGSTPRDVRREILNARLSGELICSNEHGYFRPTTEDEVKIWYRTMMSRVNTTLKMLEPFDIDKGDDEEGPDND